MNTHNSQSEPKSVCCGAPRRVCGSDEGTYYYDCQNCGKEFIPASEKEYPSHAHAGISTGNCPICSTTETPDWTEEEREAWYAEVKNTEYPLDLRMYFGDGGLYEDRVATYWLSRMAGKIEDARKEGYEKGLHDECSRWMNQDCNEHDKVIRKQGRQEERERILNLIKTMDTDPTLTRERIIEILLSANIKSNE